MGGNEDLYDNAEQVLFTTSYVAGVYAQKSGLYPSTGRTKPNNLQEQIYMNAAKADSKSGKVIISSLGDRRMPGFMGWQKLSYPYTKAHPSPSLGPASEVHYVGNKYFPFYFDFKFKDN